MIDFSDMKYINAVTRIELSWSLAIISIKNYNIMFQCYRPRGIEKKNLTCRDQAIEGIPCTSHHERAG